MSGELKKLLSDLKEAEALEYVKKSLSEGVDPADLLDQAKEGMTIVGERFADQTYFIPDLIFSGEILKNTVALIQPHLKKGERERS